jgi:hypothetical protein
MQPSLRRALEHLAGHAPVTVFLPRTRTTADNAHAELRAWLTAHDAETIEVPATRGSATALAHLQQRLFDEPRAQQEVAASLLAFAEERKSGGAACREGASVRV